LNRRLQKQSDQGAGRRFCPSTRLPLGHFTTTAISGFCCCIRSNPQHNLLKPTPIVHTLLGHLERFLKTSSKAQGCMPVVPVFRGVKQEDREFEASLDAYKVFQNNWRKKKEKKYLVLKG
jgi:hypothetical protein